MAFNSNFRTPSLIDRVIRRRRPRAQASLAELAADSLNASLIDRRIRDPIRNARYRRRWGFTPPPVWAELGGYETLLREMERHGIADVEGDVLEIGVLLGGGTAKLCGWLERHANGKRVIAVDVFDPSFDATETMEGLPMEVLYDAALQGRDQRGVFDEVTAGCSNLLLVVGDSTKVDIPSDTLAFAFVDGSHAAEDVHADFEPFGNGCHRVGLPYSTTTVATCPASLTPFTIASASTRVRSPGCGRAPRCSSCSESGTNRGARIEPA